MKNALEPHEVRVAARRADGSPVPASDVLAYVEQVKVAAGVIDGARLAEPGFHVLRMALDDEGNVAYTDDLVRDGLDWQGLVRSIAHRCATAVLVDDGVVDPQGSHHEWDDLPDELERHLDDLAETAAPALAVHVMRVDPDLDVDARLIAWSTKASVETTRIEDFIAIRESTSIAPDAAVEQALRTQLPAVSLRSDGEAREALVRVRNGRRVVECHVSRRPSPALPAVELTPDLRDLLLDSTSVTPQTKHTLEPAVTEQLAAAGSGATSFAHDVAVAIGVPVAAAAWLDGEEPPGPVEVVEPSTTRETIGHVGREVAADMRAQMVKGPLGGFRRFLLDVPPAMAAYAVGELTLAYVLGGWDGWAILRWTAVAILTFDGLVSLGIAATTLGRRVRASRR